MSKKVVLSSTAKEELSDLLDNNLHVKDLNETNINLQIFNSKEGKKYKVLENR